MRESRNWRKNRLKELVDVKIAVTSTGRDLSVQVDPRFGRCQYFIIVDTDTMDFEAIENPNISAVGGAGVQSGQLMAGKGVKAVLTGNCGPNAFSTLQAAGIEVVTGVTGIVKEAVEKYKTGQLKSTTAPTVGEKFGVGQPGPGTGLGRGMGPGMGRGMGRGGGRGMGRGRGGQDSRRF